jgi:hypothetical protein
MGGSEEITLSDLKGELASLRIDRDRPARSAWRWPLLLLMPVLLLLGGLYAFRARDAFSAVTVETADSGLLESWKAASDGASLAGYQVLCSPGPEPCLLTFSIAGYFAARSCAWRIAAWPLCWSGGSMRWGIASSRRSS